MNRALSDLHMLAPMLYMPADRPDLAAVLGGGRDVGVCSVAVCLEDAVRIENRRAAAKALCGTLASLESVPRSIFIRPADVGALEWLIEHLPLQHISGFILPKATVAKIHQWVERSTGLHTLLPILESRETLDPGGRRELAQACAAHPPLIPGARIGANDLFCLLGGLRRPPGRTIYETPLGRVVDELIEAFSGISTRLCGVVFDRVKDLETFEREVQEDIYRGLFAKTVVNPHQSRKVWAWYKPNECDLDEAAQILNPNASAVFACNGHMLETACHTRWAQKLVDRQTLHERAEGGFVISKSLVPDQLMGS
jgi:citrate lyase beta subunit